MIFYFTGTGNSLYVAKKLDANPVSIPKMLNRENLVFTDDRIGIVCPVYGHEMPAMVKEFIRKADFRTEYLYLILTYGARHGNAVELAQLALKDAGKQGNYITTLLMVDNFLPVFDMTEELKLEKNVEQQLEKIKEDITEKKHFFELVTPEDKAMHHRYTKLVKNAPATMWADFTVTEDCIGCGICTKVCPAGCIEIAGQKAISTKENCQACFACIHACPKLAIQMNIPEKNAKARYRNEHITLCEIVAANDQTKQASHQ
ncbi:MAG: EFR1 family ferrodoxin [Oscillospiraceae bacterium]